MTLTYYVFNWRGVYWHESNSANNLVGTYSEYLGDRIYYFAAFSRSIDAARYCDALNEKKVEL